MDINDRDLSARPTSPDTDDSAADPAGHARPAPSSRAAPSHAAFVTGILHARARFSDRFDASLFSDPAYDMLLALFSANEHGRTMTTNSCCAAARVPRTTALRWIKLLTARGHVIATDDPTDRRSTLLQLSPTAHEHVRQWLEECAIPAAVPPGSISGGSA